MAAAVVVVILVATAEAQSPAISAAVSAAGEALGARVAVTLRHAATPSDAEALRLEGLLNATAVGTIVWTDAAHDAATIRVRSPGSQAWLEQTVTFSAGDAPPERGRALGLTLAGMVSAAVDVALGERPTEAPRPPPREAAPAPAPPARPTGAAVVVPPPQDAATKPAEQPSAVDTWCADLRAVGVRGAGGPAEGWGASAGAERATSRALLLRADAAFRTGDIPGLGGRHRVGMLGGGVAWRPLQTGGPRRLGLGIRLELAALLHDFAHLTADGRWDHHSRVLPASTVIAEASWRVASTLELVAGTGVEIAFGKTDVAVASILVGTVPPIRLQAELGGRVWF